MDATGKEGIVLVIDADHDSASRLRDMIEFLDTPHVRVVDETGWRDAATEALSMVFLGRSLAPDAARSIARSLRAQCPPVPVVRVTDAHGCQPD